MVQSHTQSDGGDGFPFSQWSGVDGSDIDVLAVRAILDLIENRQVDLRDVLAMKDQVLFIEVIFGCDFPDVEQWGSPCDG